MNILKYEAFVAVAETGSITKASQQLQYSQPGISHMINSMEDELGFPILKRVNGKFIPTEDGKKILYYCQQIIKSEKDMKNVASAVNELTEGNISFGTYNSMMVDFVGMTVAKFSNIYPRITIRIVDKDCDEMPVALQSGALDFAFMNNDVPKGFEFIPLFRDNIGVMADKEHPFAQYDKIPVKALNGCRFVMPSTGSFDIVAVVMEKEPFQPIVAHYSSNDHIAIRLVANNLGVGIMSSMQKSLLPDNLVFRELEGEFHRTMGIAIKSQEYATPAVKEFIKFAKMYTEKMLREYPDKVIPLEDK